MKKKGRSEICLSADGILLRFVFGNIGAEVTVLRIEKLGISYQKILGGFASCCHDFGITQKVAQTQRRHASLFCAEDIARPAKQKIRLRDIEAIRGFFENLKLFQIHIRGT